MSPTVEIAKRSTILKVDEKLGLVFGFAIVCKQDGEDYFDLQHDHIPEDEMLKAAVEFMENSRAADEQHDEQQMGSVVFAMPLTSELAKSLEMETPRTGLLIAMKPSAEVFEKFADGTLTGFSIGGTGSSEEVDDADEA